MYNPGARLSPEFPENTSSIDFVPTNERLIKSNDIAPKEYSHVENSLSNTTATPKHNEDNKEPHPQAPQCQISFYSAYHHFDYSTTIRNDNDNNAWGDEEQGFGNSIFYQAAESETKPEVVVW